MVLKIYGDTEASEQALCMYATDYTYGKNTFLGSDVPGNRNGLVFVTNMTSVKFPKAVVERLKQLGWKPSDVMIEDREPEWKKGNRCCGILKFMPKGNANHLYLENYGEAGELGTLKGWYSLKDNIDNIKRVIKERELGFIAFEFARSHFNRPEDATEFFSICEKLSEETGVLIITRFLWEEHNRSVHEKYSNLSPEELAECDQGDVAFAKELAYQSELLPYIEACHNEDNGMIHVVAVDEEENQYERDIPYLPTLIQRLTGQPLKGSQPYDF